MVISNKYKYHETLDFEESITIFKAYQENNYLNWPTKFGACKGCEFKSHSRTGTRWPAFRFQTLLHKATSMDGVRIQQTNAMQIWNYRGKNLMEENRLLMQDLQRRGF
jgi:hypothetical protein